MGANTMASFKLLAPEIMNENTTEDELNDISDRIFNKTYSSAIDIYAFGIVALEMAVYGIKNNFHSNKQNQQAHPHGHRYSEPSDNYNYNNYFCELSGSFASRKTIRKAIDLLDNDLQKDFIERCLNEGKEYFITIYNKTVIINFLKFFRSQKKTNGQRASVSSDHI